MTTRKTNASPESDELTVEEKMIEDEAQYWEQHRDDAPGEEVKVRVARDVRHVYSFRVGADELDEIADAAEAAGKDVSAFIREAALNEARRRKAGDSAVDEVRRKAQELTEAVQKL
jgi:uncharacterized protein (DUF1778 family)